ncbi:MAG TPA: C40 family peptidase [Candidatus Tumulicola sp.]|nr:C40 family peptidase [Candidatus Tumulicola sp.]
MRHALAAGALVLSLAGSYGIASAATRPASAVAVSPDVATWTSHLIISTPARHASGISRFAGGIVARTTKLAALLARTALHFLGTPYVFGGTSSAGFDCSGFVQHVYAMAGIALPRTADAQYDVGRPAVGGPRVGDLVFFETYTDGVSHVGVYLGKGEFVHASSSHGVMVSHLSDAYWRSRYVGAKRLIASR